MWKITRGSWFFYDVSPRGWAQVFNLGNKGLLPIKPSLAFIHFILFGISRQGFSV